MKKKLFTTSVNGEHVLVISRDLKSDFPKLADISSYAFDVGEPFLSVLGPAWSKVVARDDNDFELQILDKDDVILTCPVARHNVAYFQSYTSYLLLEKSIVLNEKELAKEIDASYGIDEFERWMRKKEQQNQLNMGGLDGLLMGIWDDKPFKFVRKKQEYTTRLHREFFEFKNKYPKF